MTVTVTSVMPAACMSSPNTTFMFRKRPRHRHDALRRVLVPVFGLLLAAGFILWFVYAGGA